MTKWLHFHFSPLCLGEGNSKPTPVFLPGESQGRWSLIGCRLWGRTELDTTKMIGSSSSSSSMGHLSISRNTFSCYILWLYIYIYLMRRVDSSEKTLMLGGTGGKRRRGRQDEMAGWHHWLDGRESQWTPGVGDGQGGLACCDLWGHKESDTTERLIWSDLI